VLATFVALQQSVIPPRVNIKTPHEDFDPTDVDPFVFIDVWF